ncbi:MAG: hypothetical protein HY908_26490 [Myxococcales bacterium]|nr:hypothetical protein [Myxococcales bacterium]
MSKRWVGVGLLLVGAVACGGEGGTGGAGASGGSGAAGGSGGSGGSAIPLVDTALDGACVGGKPPGTGVNIGNELHKVTLDADPEALCNDGSPAIMYVRKAATVQATNRWVIHMQPGGSCSDYDVCYDRWCGIGAYEADKMSSRFAPEATNGSGIFARNANNAFGNLNQVYIYYCSSDGWIGRRSDAVLEDTTGTRPTFRLHFRGHDILEAAAAALAAGVTSDDGVETLPSLDAATHVLFSGSSAGSNGLSHTLDWWAAQVPNATQVGGMLDSIFLPLPEDVTDPTIAATYLTGMQAQWTTVKQTLYHAFTDESCLALHPGADAYLCGLTSHLQLDHTTTPFFSRQDLTDPVSAQYLEAAGATIPQIAAWTYTSMLRLAGALQSSEEQASMTVAPGSYASNCGQHIVMLNSTWFGVAQQNNATVEGAGGTPLTVHDALGAWMLGTPIAAIDTEPSTVSFCPATTSEQ